MNLSAKAVWRFESVDRSHAHRVKWRAPVRLRHVPSNKLLSVNSLNCADIASSRRSPVSLSPRGGGPSFFDAALVHDEDPSAEDGAFGSASSLAFQLTPTDAAGTDTVNHGVSTVRIEHYSSALGVTLHLASVPGELKPHLMRTPDDELGSESEPSSSSSPSPSSSSSPPQTSLRLLFSTIQASVDVVKLLPVTDEEGLQIDRCTSCIPLFRLYAILFQSHTPRGGVLHKSSFPAALCAQLAEQCLDAIEMLRKGKPPPRRHGSIAESMKEANAVLPATFASFFAGEPNARVQRVTYEVRLQRRPLLCDAYSSIFFVYSTLTIST